MVHADMFRFPQKSLHPLTRRIRSRLLTLFGNQPPRNNAVYRVEIEGHRVKRACMADSFEAQSHAANRRTFGPDGLSPALILRKENELWVEYIEGERLREVDRDILDKLAALFAVLYRRDPVLVPIEETHYNHTLHVDLNFLHGVGVLSAARYRELAAMADRVTPTALWIGYACVAANLKNFLLCPAGRIRSLEVAVPLPRWPISPGPATALAPWLGSEREYFLDALTKHSVPDFRPYMSFLELAFSAFWQKNCVLERKSHFVRPELFDRFVD